MKRAASVWVRNNGKIVFSDRYDGEDFSIPPGGVTEILVETAELCLGFGQEDKTRCIRRLGWAFTQNNMSEALSRLGTFSFHMTEKEALAHKPSKLIGSSAPAGDETPGDPQGEPGGVVTRQPLNLLQKLAQAQPPAG